MRALAALLAGACVAGIGGGARADGAALIAAERPSGGWGFAHPEGRRPTPCTWLVETAERIATPVGLATWDLLAIRSPGTPAAGLLLLDAGTDDALEAARRAGDLLVATQLRGDGWPSELPVHGRELPGWFRLLAIRPALDDDVTPGAIRFLLALWRRTGDDHHRLAAERAIALLVREQHPAGGWPLVGRPAWMHRLRPASFVRLALNDGATPLVITTLLEAADVLGRPDLRAAAVRGAEWLVRVRGDAPAWAQQYDVAGRPAAARRFEVPALATWETRHAIDALLAVARATGDARFCAPAADAVRWLERVAVAPGCWARLHDLDTGAPVYVDARGQRVVDPYAARPGYSWMGEFGIPALLARLGRAPSPPFGAPLPGDPGVCPDRRSVTAPMRGARAIAARLARARPVRPLDLGPCAGQPAGAASASGKRFSARARRSSAIGSVGSRRQ